MNATNPSKPTKLQSLTASLEVAKKSLADATARLQPQIDTEQVRIDQLQKAYEKASKASSKAYETFGAEQRNANNRLFPIGSTTALEAAIRAHVGAQFPQADTMRLAHEYKDAKVAADMTVQMAKNAWMAARDMEESTRKTYWGATAPNSQFSKMVAELSRFQDRVAELEKEIERLPRYRQAAKDRREQERQEQEQHEQTKAARAMMSTFTFGA